MPGLNLAARLKRAFYPELVTGGFSRHDGSVAFYGRLQALLEPDMTVLDYGCGRGFYGQLYAGDRTSFRRDLHVLKGKVRRVIGADVDPGAKNNPFLDEFHLLPANGRLPLADRSVDLCVNDWVVEHLADPAGFFREVARVLKPGGYLCLRTPNLLHYVGLGACLVPNRLHDAMLKRLGTDHESEYVFDTYYRCNTVFQLRSALRRAGFDPTILPVETEPTYLEKFAPLLLLGVLYQKLAPGFLRHELQVFARRV